MKKLILILLLFSSLLLCGCESKNDTPNNIEENKELKIRLYYAPTAGESWESSISSLDIVEIEEDYESICEDDVDGCGGYNIYKIIPKKEGVVTITFNLKHISGVEDSRFAKYTITVDKNLNITETHTGTYFNE